MRGMPVWGSKFRSLLTRRPVLLPISRKRASSASVGSAAEGNGSWRRRRGAGSGVSSPTRAGDAARARSVISQRRRRSRRPSIGQVVGVQDRPGLKPRSLRKLSLSMSAPRGVVGSRWHAPRLMKPEGDGLVGLLLPRAFPVLPDALRRARAACRAGRHARRAAQSASRGSHSGAPLSSKMCAVGVPL